MRQIYTALEFNNIRYSNLFNVTLDSDLYSNQLRGSRTIREQKIAGRDVPYFYNVEDEPLEFELTLALINPVTESELRTIIRTFLNQRNYSPLTFGDLDGSTYTAKTPIFYVLFDKESIFDYTYRDGNKYLGYLKLNARCNAPYGFENTKFFNLNQPQTLHINSGDLNSKPKIKISSNTELNNIVIQNDLYPFFNSNSSELTNRPQGFFFKPDGTKVFTIDDDLNLIFEYSVSVSWDINTLNPVPNYEIDISSEDNQKRGIFISEDGTKIYTIGNQKRKIYQYILDTPWDLSSITTDPVESSTTFPSGKTYHGLFFSPDLNRVYILQSTDEIIYVYNVASGDIAISFDSIVAQISVGSEEPTPTGLFIGDSGNKLYIVGGGAGSPSTKFIHEYNFNTPYGTNATYTNNKVVVQTENTTCVQFKTNGEKMFLIGSTSEVIDEYIVPSPWSLGENILSKISFSKILENETITIDLESMLIFSNLENESPYERWNRDSLIIFSNFNKFVFEPSTINVEISYKPIKYF